MSHTPANKNYKFLVWTIIILTITIRLLQMADSGGDPSSQQPIVDSSTYHNLASGLARDGIFDEHFLYQAPLYPLLLAGVYKIFGISLLAVKLLQILLAAGTCLLTIRLGQKLFSLQTGLIAGLMVALCGPLLFFDQQLLATSLAVFWMVALAYLTLKVQQQDAKSFSWPALLLGLTGALAILTRPTFLPIVALLLLWPFNWRQLPKRLGLGIAGLMVILVPFSLTMQNLTGHTGILPPSGAINLFIGNNTHFEQTIAVRIGLPWERLVKEPVRYGYKPGPWNGQPYYHSLVKQFVRQHPGEFLELLVKKTAHLLTSRELPRNVDIYVHRQYSKILSLLVFKIGNWGFPMALLLPLAAIGLWVSGLRRCGPLPWILATYAASLILVFVASRYRAPLLPLIIILAAQALVWLWDQTRQRNWRALAPAAVIFVAMTLFATIPGPFAQEKSDLESELHYAVGWNYYQQENWEQAEKELRQALALDSNMPEARNFLGLVLAQHQQWDEAAEHFKAATRLAPDYTDALHNLELCQSKRAEAHYRQGRDIEESNPQQAMAIFQDVLGFYPQWPEVTVRLAWMLATATENTLRDGHRSLKLLSQPSVEKLAQDPYVMFVKSAALAETGDFEQAIIVARQAQKQVAETTKKELTKQLDEALSLYKSGKRLAESPHKL